MARDAVSLSMAAAGSVVSRALTFLSWVGRHLLQALAGCCRLGCRTGLVALGAAVCSRVGGSLLLVCGGLLLSGSGLSLDTGVFLFIV